MNQANYRVIDANCNRAREALRVLEDYARFTLNHAGLSGQLKALRHGFQSATADLQRRAVASRDTGHDVGTGIKAETERQRESLSAVVTAAGKRLGEALRTIEEYAKVETDVAPAIESLRYRFYDIEKQVLATLTPGRDRVARVRLCVLITESLCRRPWLETARLAIEGGAEMIQLREKTLDAGELLNRARALAALCRSLDAVFIVNDRPDVALLSGADGVHVGQSDLPVTGVRQIMGPDAVIGVSTHAIDQASRAVTDGADYIGVGPVFPSQTKPQNRLAGLAYARAVASEIRLPALAISGITGQNIASLLETGLRGIAVSSAIIAAPDPRAAAREIRGRLS